MKSIKSTHGQVGILVEGPRIPPILAAAKRAFLADVPSPSTSRLIESIERLDHIRALSLRVVHQSAHRCRRAAAGRTSRLYRKAAMNHVRISRVLPSSSLRVLPFRFDGSMDK